jgi:hypothetical protein
MRYRASENYLLLCNVKGQEMKNTLKCLPIIVVLVLSLCFVSTTYSQVSKTSTLKKVVHGTARITGVNDLVTVIISPAVVPSKCVVRIRTMSAVDASNHPVTIFSFTSNRITFVRPAQITTDTIIDFEIEEHWL